MKTFIRTCLSALLVSASVLALAPRTDAEGSGAVPTLSGVFVAPENVTGEGGSAWTADDWLTALTQLKAVGITDVVLQYAVQYQTDANKGYYFEPAFESPAGADTTNKRVQIPYALAAAKALGGMKIWLGLHIAEDAWFSAQSAGFADTTFLTAHAAYSEQVFDDLYTQFGAAYADELGGWYLPFEFNNSEVRGAAKDRLIENFYTPLTAYIKTKSTLPILISPLIYAPLVGAATAAETADWRMLLQDIWTRTNVDIIAPQDGCGWESTVAGTLAPWYSAMKQALDAAKPVHDAKGKGEAAAWNNPECYSMSGVRTMTMQRLTGNMRAVDQYVSAHVSFSIHSLVYLDEGKSGAWPINRAYYNAYKYIVDNGNTLYETHAIPAPASFAAVLNGIDAELSWSRTVVGGDQLIAGYELWRQEGAGETIRIKDIPQPDDSVITVIDSSLDPGKTYTYSVYAFDGSGNRSAAPAAAALTVQAPGMPAPRDFGENFAASAGFSVDGFVNAVLSSGTADLLNDGVYGSAVGDISNLPDTWLRIAKAADGQTSKFSLNITNSTGLDTAFVYISMLHQPASGAFLPEKLEVLSGDTQAACVYPYRDYYSSAAGMVWIPVALPAAVSGDLSLVFTGKYRDVYLSEIRLYSAENNAAAYTNLASGRPVFVGGFILTQDFVPTRHFRGIMNSTIDTQKGLFETGILTYKSTYASRIPTGLSAERPYLPWNEDASAHSVWFGISDIGSVYEASVDLKAPSYVHGVEIVWQIDRDAAVFLPEKIEFTATGIDGKEKIVGTALRPSVALINFTEESSAVNTHRTEQKSFRVVDSGETLYKKITAKIYVQYPKNTYFMGNFSVY